MLRLIDDLPPDVIGLEAAGKVTHEDPQQPDDLNVAVTFGL